MKSKDSLEEALHSDGEEAGSEVGCKLKEHSGRADILLVFSLCVVSQSLVTRFSTTVLHFWIRKQQSI